MEIAIISDSHYAVESVERLMAHIEEKKITHLIHAGDFIGQGIDKVFERYPGITSYIARGNCDMYGDVMESMKKLPNVTVGEILKFELCDIRFIVSHIPGMALSALSKSGADVVIHGHTHRPLIETFKNTLVLNPGSIMDGDGFMVLDLPSLKVDRRFNF
ncbi:YfcE family phosphodiesterase [bacterium]|nr:YfcE family phosphodiesterase [bacterium]